MNAIPVSGIITLSTLASNTVIKTDLMTLAEDYYWLSVDLEWSIRDQTPGEGPIEVGIAHSDYTVTEILENLAVNLTGPGNKVGQEQQRRLIRRSGTFPGTVESEVLRDGTAIRTRAKFMLDGGEGPAFWALNRSGAALSGGAIVRFSGTMFGRWVY